MCSIEFFRYNKILMEVINNSVFDLFKIVKSVVDPVHVGLENFISSEISLIVK